MAYSVSALEAFNLPMKRTFIPFCVLALCCCLSLATTACGQRGPLYLPDKESAADDPTPAESVPGKEPEESDEENS